jgi:endo-1,4-beta-xylanase
MSLTRLPVYITEYDINLADDTQRQTVMQSRFTFWNDSNVKGITLWGYIVGATGDEQRAMTGMARPE